MFKDFTMLLSFVPIKLCIKTKSHEFKKINTYYNISWAVYIPFPCNKQHGTDKIQSCVHEEEET